MSNWRGWRVPSREMGGQLRDLAFNWPLIVDEDSTTIDDHVLCAISFVATDYYLSGYANIKVGPSMEVAVFKKGNSELFVCGRALQRPNERKIFATCPPTETLEDLRAWYLMVAACAGEKP